MLIVNADDLGRDRQATDTALDCFRSGRVTSASAMVFMQDSTRAAELAKGCGLEVGLHLNFTEPYSQPNCPPQVMTSHNRIRRFLRRSKYALLIYHPLLAAHFRRVVAAQLAEFERLYGQAPVHFDGHQHMHLSTNMMFGRFIPAGTKVRRSFSFRRGQKSYLNRLYRRLVDRSLARRHSLTDFFFALSQHLPAERLASIFALAKTANVELMTHPWNLPEYECLNSDSFRQLSQGVRMGRYAELSGAQ